MRDCSPWPNCGAAVDEAHRHGLPINGHAHGRDGIAAAVQAGFDGVEHASFFTGTQVQPDPAVIAARPLLGCLLGAACIAGNWRRDHR